MPLLHGSARPTIGTATGHNMHHPIRAIVAFTQTISLPSHDPAEESFYVHAFAVYFGANSASADPATPELLMAQKIRAPIQRAMRESTVEIRGQTASMWTSAQIDEFAPLVSDPLAQSIARGSLSPFVLARLPRAEQTLMSIEEAQTWSERFRQALSRALFAPVVDFVAMTALPMGMLTNPPVWGELMSWEFSGLAQLHVPDERRKVVMDTVFADPALVAMRESILLSETVDSADATASRRARSL